MSESEHEMRRRLAQTWKALMARMTDYDLPVHIVFETMAEVATAGMLERYGSSAAAQMLRLRADAIKAEEADRVQKLLAGENETFAPPIAAILPGSSLEPWPAHAADQGVIVDLIGR